MRISERNCPADTKVSAEGDGDASGTGAEFPLQPTVKTTVRQLCSCSPFRSMINQTISDALRLQRRKKEDHKCYFPNTWQISPPVMFSELTVLSNSEVTNGIETSSYLGVLRSSIQFLGNSLLNT